MNFIVLSSSRGTTFQAVLDQMAAGEVTATCLGLVTDDSERQCIDKAKAANLPYKVVARVKGEEREEFDKRVNTAIEELIAEVKADKSETILAEMGWMWIHTPWFISQWSNRILNVHPALLPKHGGKGMYGDHVHQAVLDEGDEESGVTIHIMSEEVDEGPKLVQKNCSVEADETVESLKSKVQSLEKEWYPKTLQMIETGEIVLPETAIAAT